MLWPTHCVQHTSGAELIPEIDAERVDLLVSKGLDPGVEMYSAFNNIFGDRRGADVDLVEYLEKRGITHVYACGLTGDVCVYENAMGAKRAGFEVILLQDAVRSVDQEQFKSAAKEMESIGIVLTDSEGADVARVASLA